jgi:hypothetical protein
MSTDLKLLSQLFYDPKLGLVNANSLYDKAKEHNIKVSYKDVINFYNKQSVNQVMKRITKLRNSIHLGQIIQDNFTRWIS